MIRELLQAAPQLCSSEVADGLMGLMAAPAAEGHLSIQAAACRVLGMAAVHTPGSAVVRRARECVLRCGWRCRTLSIAMLEFVFVWLHLSVRLYTGTPVHSKAAAC